MPSSAEKRIFQIPLLRVYFSGNFFFCLSDLKIQIPLIMLTKHQMRLLVRIANYSIFFIYISEKNKRKICHQVESITPKRKRGGRNERKRHFKPFFRP